MRHEWQGPLPPPAVLEQFDNLVDQGAERIMRQWELETDHRRQYEQAALRSTYRLELFGRLIAFTFAMSALAVAAYAASLGESWVASVLGGGTIVGVVAALVYRGRDAQHGQTGRKHHP